jgi:thiamine kinase-like enzyme
MELEEQARFMAFKIKVKQNIESWNIDDLILQFLAHRYNDLQHENFPAGGE